MGKDRDDRRYKLLELEVLALYPHHTGRQIEKILDLPWWAVYRILRRHGIRPRSRTALGTGYCLECGKPCGKALRCAWHRKLRHAALSRAWQKFQRSRSLSG